MGRLTAAHSRRPIGARSYGPLLVSPRDQQGGAPWPELCRGPGRLCSLQAMWHIHSGCVALGNAQPLRGSLGSAVKAEAVAPPPCGRCWHVHGTRGVWGHGAWASVYPWACARQGRWQRPGDRWQQMRGQCEKVLGLGGSGSGLVALGTEAKGRSLGDAEAPTTTLSEHPATKA